MRRIDMKNLALFAAALVIGICFSYVGDAQAGIVSDMFKEPIDDFIALITEDLGNTMALLGVVFAIGIAVWYQSLGTGIALVLVVGVIWSAMESFA